MRCFILLIVTALCGAAFAVAGSASRAMPMACLDAGDRTTKLTLIQQLTRSPQILILGSSRARRAQPLFLQRLTGLSGFNAAVQSGDSADTWVMVRFTADRFPRKSRQYLWFVDSVIAENHVHPDLAADPRARTYLDPGIPPSIAGCHLSSRYHTDGSIAHEPSIPRRKRAKIVAKTVATLVARIKSRSPAGQTVDPQRYSYFERAIAFMNQQGVQPVIVINPIHPRVLAELEKRGFPARKIAQAYLGQLKQRLNFVVVDCEDIRAWGGSAANFDDATHVDSVNMRRMLAYVVAHSDGMLG